MDLILKAIDGCNKTEKMATGREISFWIYENGDYPRPQETAMNDAEYLSWLDDEVMSMIEQLNAVGFLKFPVLEKCGWSRA